MPAAEPPKTYQCPGESYLISRSIHLGRLASFYPKCRQCPHHDDTGPIDSRTLRHLSKVRTQRAATSLFDDEGVGGVYRNELDQAVTREIAAAFAESLRESAGEGQRQVFSGLAAIGPVGACTRPMRVHQPGSVVVGHDERLSSPDLVTGAGDGLRRCGGQVVRIGAVSAACLSYAVSYLSAAGGIYIGGGGGGAHTNRLRFSGRDARPITRRAGLGDVERLWGARASLRSRHAGPLHLFQADVPYTASLLKHFHALRPLHVVIHAESSVVRAEAGRVLGNSPCRVSWQAPTAVAPLSDSGPLRGTRSATARDGAGGPHLRRARAVRCDWPTVPNLRADLGVVIAADEAVRFYDEQGCALAAEIAAELLGKTAVQRQGGGCVVLESKMATKLRGSFAGVKIATADPDPAEMYAAMLKRDAVFGGGASARWWFADGGVRIDPLIALSMMLGALSVSDLAVSKVVEQMSGVTPEGEAARAK